MRYAMAIDLRTCMGCASCVVACKVANDVDDGLSRCRVTERLRGEFPALQLTLYSERCNHCGEAPCVSNCPTGASHYAEGGIVAVDAARCTGCKACLAACPYDARFINRRGVAEKCDFCLERLRRGEEPVCVATCPSRAMLFGDLDDPSSEISRTLAARPHRPLLAEAGTRPHVFYLE
jgi:Fe-S-cluster-containing dehydrogenase component